MKMLQIHTHTNYHCVIKYLYKRDSQTILISYGTVECFWCHTDPAHFLLAFHLQYIGYRMGFDGPLSFGFMSPRACRLLLLRASECRELPLSGAMQLIALISSPAAGAVVGLWGTLYLPSPRQLSNNTLPLRVNGLWGLNLDCGWSPSCLRLMSERGANSQGFARACSAVCAKGLGETNPDTHVMVIQLDSLAWTA